MSHTVGGVDFEEFETYAFLPGASSPGFDDAIIRFRSLNKVQAELEARGFELDAVNPDFFVRIHAFFTGYNDPTLNPDFRSPFEDPGVRLYFQGQTPVLARPSEEIPEIAYAPGTLVVEILDAADGSLLWNAWSEQPIGESALPEDLENYIGRLFEGFPVLPQ